MLLLSNIFLLCLLITLPIQTDQKFRDNPWIFVVIHACARTEEFGAILSYMIIVQKKKPEKVESGSGSRVPRSKISIGPNDTSGKKEEQTTATESVSASTSASDTEKSKAETMEIELADLEV